MKALDIFLLVLILIGAYRGFRRGLILELVAIIAFIVAIIISFKMLHWGIAFLKTYLGRDLHYLLPYIAFILIFIGVVILIGLIGRLLKKTLDFTLLGSFDRFAGAIVGIVKWAFGISIIFWLSTSVGIEVPSNISEGTFIYPVVNILAPTIIEKMSVLFPFLEDLFDSIKKMLTPHLS